MNHLFLITSAIQTNFGKFDCDDRLLQTLNTIQSVYTYCPGAKVIVIESSGVKVEKTLMDRLSSVTTAVVDLSGNDVLKQIHDETDNWDLVKNLSEMLAFNTALVLLKDNGYLNDVDRVHKLSGRYKVNEDFDMQVYEDNPKKIIVPMKLKTQFPDRAKIKHQYMSRLWSWPVSEYENIRKFYDQAITEFRQRMLAGEHVDLEHLMYHLLPKRKVHSVDIIGVHGRLGQTNEFVRN